MAFLLGFAGILILIGILSLISAVIKEAKSNQLIEPLQKAKKEYFDSLAKLKTDSTNTELRHTTLQLGRVYSGITRKLEGNGQVTIYDELALMNDINAACGGSTGGIVSNAQNTEERLAKLSELKEKGFINGDEYEGKRQKILDEI